MSSGTQDRNCQQRFASALDARIRLRLSITVFQEKITETDSSVKTDLKFRLKYIKTSEEKGELVLTTRSLDQVIGILLEIFSNKPQPLVDTTLINVGIVGANFEL